MTTDLITPSPWTVSRRHCHPLPLDSCAVQCPTVGQMPDARMFSNVQYKHGQTDKSQHHHHLSIKQNLPSPPAPRLPTELTAIPTAHATHSRHVHAHPPPISRSPKLVITNIGRRPEVLSTLVRGGNQGGKRDTTLGPYSTETVRGIWPEKTVVSFALKSGKCRLKAKRGP